MDKVYCAFCGHVFGEVDEPEALNRMFALLNEKYSECPSCSNVLALGFDDEPSLLTEAEAVVELNESGAIARVTRMTEQKRRRWWRRGKR